MRKTWPPAPEVQVQMAIRADFDVDVVKCDVDGNPIPGTMRRVLTKCKNLFTNTGMDNIGTASWLAYTAFLQVGSGSAVPANSDTTLTTYIAGVGPGGIGDNVWAWDTVNPKALVYTRVFQYAAGAATGSIRELGLSTTGTTGNLCTHALFKDPFGDPTTVVIAADEQLVVTYRIYFVPNESDSVFIVTQGATEYTLTTRMLGLGTRMGTLNNYPMRNGLFGERSDLNHAMGVYIYYGVTSGLGAITAIEPIGTVESINGPPRTYGTYTPGNYYRDDVMTIPLNTANQNDIGAIGFYGATPFCAQVGIVPRVNKTSLDTIRFTMRTSWSRG